VGNNFKGAIKSVTMAKGGEAETRRAAVMRS
jgi:hypothetical protein